MATNNKKPTTRLDRIEAAIEAMAEQHKTDFAELRQMQRQAVEDTAEFKRVVRGAFEVQQQQIARNAEAIARLEKYMEAHLRSDPQ